ncbi:hypothetical protein PVAP13_3NG276182 [Panicum virgatum]|uniref:Uncharacterized protein n=1 Tax=Panicum virgatum TaxID=38727 RepID=A0A8T0UJG7_PANVG|nr:hypothetical protein PVAP13_3NG276182 [Panicum virgatum]
MYRLYRFHCFLFLLVNSLHVPLFYYYRVATKTSLQVWTHYFLSLTQRVELLWILKPPASMHRFRRKGC